MTLKATMALEDRMSKQMGTISTAMYKATNQSELLSEKLKGLQFDSDATGKAMDDLDSSIRNLTKAQEENYSKSRQSQIDKQIKENDMLGKKLQGLDFNIKKTSNSYQEQTKKSSDLAKEMQELENKTEEVGKTGSSGFSKWQASLVSLTSAMSLLSMGFKAIQQLIGSADQLVQKAQAQDMAESKLSISMKNRMGATDSVISSTIAYTKEMQSLGIISDAVQIAGQAQLASFVTQSESIIPLTNSMNDLIAKQYGLNATQSNAAEAANKLGKAMNGNAESLREMGLKVSDADTKLFKMGTEQEKVARLTELIGGYAGGMNAELAKTPYGRIQSVNNALEDMEERFGKLLLPVKVAFKETFLDVALFIEQGMAKGVEFVKGHANEIATAITIIGAIALTAGIIIATGWIIANVPLVLIIVAIGLLIKILVDLGVSAEQIMSFVGGLFGGFFSLVDMGITFMWNKVVIFAEFFINVFNDPIGAVGRLFFDLFDNVLSVIANVAGAIDLLFGSKLQNSVNSFRADMASLKTETFGTAEFQLEKRVATDFSTSVTGGAKFGADIGNKITEGLGKITGMDLGTNLLGGTGDLNFDGNGNLKTANQNEIKISEEDIKMLYDISTRDYQLNYKQITPNFNVNVGTVRETADFNGVINYLADNLAEISSTRLVVG